MASPQILHWLTSFIPSGCRGHSWFLSPWSPLPRNVRSAIHLYRARRRSIHSSFSFLPHHSAPDAEHLVLSVIYPFSWICFWIWSCLVLSCHIHLELIFDALVDAFFSLSWFVAFGFLMEYYPRIPSCGLKSPESPWSREGDIGLCNQWRVTEVFSFVSGAMLFLSSLMVSICFPLTVFPEYIDIDCNMNHRAFGSLARKKSFW